jgi:cysteine desulfurase/selenocysteine lyase
MFNSSEIKKEFPLLGRKVDGKNLVYFDNASTAPKPAVVIEAEAKFYEEVNANVHRGVYKLSEIASLEYENARVKCADLIGADNKEIVFVKNATEAANLVAYSYGEIAVGAGDNIVVSELEHHANFLPWVELAKRKGAELRVLKIKNAEGELENIENLLDEKTKIVAITQMSNVLGLIPDLDKIVKAARKVGAVVMLDAAQGISHLGLNVKELPVDFAVVSGHKMFGPMGIGFLYGRKELLEKMPAFMTGGGMVKQLEENDGEWESEWLDAPLKFEAGTPNVAGAIALGAAVDWLKKFKFAEIIEHDRALLKYAREQFAAIEGVKLYGPTDLKKAGGILAFSVEGVHPHDIATIFSEFGICIRAGHHCAKPLLKALDLQAVSRISFHLYNSKEEIDLAVEAMRKVKNIFA